MNDNERERGKVQGNDAGKGGNKQYCEKMLGNKIFKIYSALIY